MSDAAENKPSKAFKESVLYAVIIIENPYFFTPLVFSLPVIIIVPQKENNKYGRKDILKNELYSIMLKQNV